MGKTFFIAVDVLMLSLMYFGPYGGNEYATMLFWGILVILSAMTLVVLVMFSTESSRTAMKISTTSVPNPSANKVLMVYDLFFAILLSGIGFYFIALVWWSIQFFTRSAINTMTNEIIKENTLEH